MATNDVLSYVQYRHDRRLERQAYHILYPAYGTYMGDAVGYGFPRYSNPLYLGGILAGHAMGRSLAPAFDESRDESLGLHGALGSHPSERAKD